MDDWIAARTAFAEVLENPPHVCVGERLDQVFDQPGERLVIQTRAGDLLEEGAQERIGSRNQSLRLFTGKFRGAARDTGTEQTVGQGLREHVREFLDRLGFPFRVGVWRQLGQQGAGEGGAPIPQLHRGLFVVKCTGNDVPDNLSKRGQMFGELLSGERNGVRHHRDDTFLRKQKTGAKTAPGSVLAVV